MPQTKNSSESRQELLLRARAAMLLIERRAVDDFDYFIRHVFALSFEDFTTGQYISDVAAHMDSHEYAMYITGRGHFKSTRLYARLMWRLLRFKYNRVPLEGWYFSYNMDMSSYHLGKVREMIARNPYYRQFRNYKSQTESVLGFAYLLDGERLEHAPKFIIKPAGLLTFKRGIHAELIYVDDPLKDPENKLRPTVILKVNRIIKTELLPMVNKGGECYVVGTPQTSDDFFFDKELQTRFATWFTPAIVDETRKTPLWPEWMTYEDLMQIKRAQGEKTFAQEYMASPVYAEESYLDRDRLTAACVNEPWAKQDWSKQLASEYVVGGHDIGKKAHPSHLALFIRSYNEDGELVFRQIYSYWMDGWEYKRQVNFLNDIIELFNVSRLLYDNTRSEFEGFAEQGLLNPVMEPLTLNARNEVKMAANHGALLDSGRITYVSDDRQLRQLLAVDNNLDALAGPDGHGDSFWSTSMAVFDDDEGISIRSF